MSAQLPTPEQLSYEVHNALSGIYGKYGLMLTNWAMAVEAITPAGDRELDSLTSPDLAPWDALGRLRYLLIKEEAGIYQLVNEGEGDDLGDVGSP